MKHMAMREDLDDSPDGTSDAASHPRQVAVAQPPVLALKAPTSESKTRFVLLEMGVPEHRMPLQQLPLQSDDPNGVGCATADAGGATN